jgi:hypothetical protein
MSVPETGRSYLNGSLLECSRKSGVHLVDVQGGIGHDLIALLKEIERIFVVRKRLGGCRPQAHHAAKPDKGNPRSAKQELELNESAGSI